LKKIAVFASGSGSNAENIIKWFSEKNAIAKVAFVVTNNPKAGVISRCKRLSIPIFTIKNSELENSAALIHFLKQNNIEMIVLAGFLRKINHNLIDAYPNKIVNIHPSLLPNYGGKGMYGNYVHEAVVKANEKESGITIHYVNQNYDEGAVIFQAKCSLENGETAASLAQKIHQLEQDNFPRVLEQLLQSGSFNQA
jgi:phosphoribosylglycinamide formyltransferase-1